MKFCWRLKVYFIWTDKTNISSFINEQIFIEYWNGYKPLRQWYSFVYSQEWVNRGCFCLPLLHFSLFFATLIKVRTKTLISNKVKKVNRMDLPEFWKWATSQKWLYIKRRERIRKTSLVQKTWVSPRTKF